MYILYIYICIYVCVCVCVYMFVVIICDTHMSVRVYLSLSIPRSKCGLMQASGALSTLRLLKATQLVKARKLEIACMC